MRAVLRFVGGFVLGTAIGAAFALLLAPRSGAETQHSIQERIQAVVAEGQQAREARRLELTSQLEALKRPAA